LKCGGCLQEFCFNHLADHRQELSKQLDKIEVSRDLFRQTLTEQTTDQQKHALIQQIDDWERDSIKSIQKTAEEAREKLLKHITEQIEKLEIELNTLTKQLQQSREENDFYETDLNHWNEELTRLTKELSKPPNINLQQISTALVYKLCVDTISG
jgi:chromosome segregation ATPase